MVARLGDSVSLLQDRLSARLRRRAAARARARRRPARKCSSISSCTTSATRSRRASRASPGSARRFSPCMPIRRPCRRPSRRAQARPAHPRGHGADLLRRRRSRRRRLSTSPSPNWWQSARRRRRRLGVDGLVCSAEEAARAAHHRQRRHGAGDAGHPAGRRRQGRPEADHDAGSAIAAGSDYLVVGRPVIAAPDPKAAAEAIMAEIAQALDDDKQEGKRDGEGLLDRARRCSQRWTATRHMRRRTRAIFNKYGGRFLVRGGRFESMEGACAVAQRGDRIQGLRDRAGLLQSPEYQANIKVAAAAFDRRSHHRRRL